MTSYCCLIIMILWWNENLFISPMPEPGHKIIVYRRINQPNWKYEHFVLFILDHHISWLMKEIAPISIIIVVPSCKYILTKQQSYYRAVKLISSVRMTNTKNDYYGFTMTLCQSSRHISTFFPRCFQVVDERFWSCMPAVNCFRNAVLLSYLNWTWFSLLEHRQLAEGWLSVYIQVSVCQIPSRISQTTMWSDSFCLHL